LTERSATRKREGLCLALLFAALLLLVAASSAPAATVVNGNFESGSLSGWNVDRATEAGNWFAYGGTEAPIGRKRGADPVQPPPQGAYAAVTDEANPDTLVLYQDVALEPGRPHFLNLLAYYNSYKPIAVPAPDTLSVDEEVLGSQANQQFRIDVMRPEAPLESIAPADILRTVFRTKPGAPVTLAPTSLTADLSPFAGQTVRLRIANAVHEEVFNAGVDAVSISATPAAKTPSRDRLSLGKARANRRSGIVTLTVRVPGAGLVTARGPRVRRVGLKANSARTIQLRLRPTPAAGKLLQRKHRLRAQVRVSFDPAGLPPETASRPLVFLLKRN
jgi:hypothetical protein